MGRLSHRVGIVSGEESNVLAVKGHGAPTGGGAGDGLAVRSWRKETSLTVWMEALQKMGWVGLGGFLGANARYWLGGWIQAHWGTEFPWGTFVINMTGSFVLGLFMTLVTERFIVPHVLALRLAVAIGFVGAYTTFSTFEYETLALVTTSAWVRAFGNAFGSLVAGFLSVWLGVLLARIL